MLTVLTFLILLVVAAAAFAGGYRWAKLRHRAPALPELAPPSGAIVPAHEAGQAAAHVPEPARVRFLPDAPVGSAEWNTAMKDVGDRMRAAGVGLVLFAHGSFVGDDPLGIARVVEDAAPALPEIARGLRGFTRSNVSRFLGDLSNFTDGYVQDFARATSVPAAGFTWSGENHHAARIQGAVRLARTLALHGGGTLRPGARVLLLGHSHGGQLFAILSQLVARARGYEDLIEAARARGEDVGALEEHLALLRRCGVDVATFGTPPRYGWAAGAGFRSMHIVNHRGAAPRALSLRGVLHTRHGDYVHHLGIHGSDFPAPTKEERAINARLDRWLGEGQNVRAWLRHVARGVRVAPQGQTVLVDYGDDARAVPNFLASGLGHAAYTRHEAMLFHARLVAGEFYPARGAEKDRPWVERLKGWRAPKLLPPPRKSPSSPEA